MEKIEKDELKRKFKLKFEAERIDVETPIDSQEAIEAIVNALYERYQRGENVYVEKYTNSPTRLVKYKMYSCDFEGTTKEQFLSKAQHRDRTIEKAEDIVVRNGSYQLPERMLEDFDKGSDTIYVFNGHNGISAVFDRYDLDVRTDEDFLDYTTILMEGESREEKRQREEAIQRKTQLERAGRIEEIKKQMPKWIEEGNSIIYEERQEDWEKYVESFQGDDIVYASIIGQALEIMKCLDQTGSLIEAEQVFKEQGHSGISSDEVIDIIFKFSKRGPDFYEDVMRYVQGKEIDEETARKILSQRADNNQYAHAEKIRKGSYGITTAEVGKATLGTPITTKKSAQKVEDTEIGKNEREGEEVGDDN